MHSPINTPDRYEEHEWVTNLSIAQRRMHLHSLPSKERKRETRRLQHLEKRANKRVAAAVSQYGPAYRRGWASGTLRDRANIYGLGARYGAYTILSAVIHGSSGGLIGSTRDTDGRQIHRTGANLQLASMAWFEGFTSFEHIGTSLLGRVPSPVGDELLALARAGLAIWPDLHLALKAIDEKLWPKDIAPSNMTVLAIYPGNKRRWFVFDGRQQMLVRADPPDEEPDLGALPDVTGYDPRYGGRPLTCFLPEITVKPRSGSRPIPASALLVPDGYRKTRPPFEDD